ncbi:hypothetical protein EV294_1261 [Paenibacillus sp. BK033]|uniref:hypothetical protein n=1 Tax=Paenibacillus sp. BK033 TaxID=2512133 RepID=UPI00104506A6|nr:hypothetical protein [Paenibacillus sp. BK033]TCM85421.1 hypothetical protein EV294_1261 [Paenibacillus sp. BK033]
MSNHVYKILGTILMIVSGLIFTLERCIANISNSLIVAGFASDGTVPDLKLVEYPKFTDNLFVVLFLIFGILIFAYGLIRKR